MLLEFITAKQFLVQTGAVRLPCLSVLCWLFLYPCTLTRRLGGTQSVLMRLYVYICLCMWYVFVFSPPHPSLCVCGSEYGSTVTSLADGMMAVITTFQRAPIGSIKAHWLSAEQGSRSSVQADACDKIMIRPLSGFHIDRLTTAYRCHHLTCPGPLLMTQQLTGPLEQWGLQENWVQGKKAPEYKVHLFNYSGM